MALRIIMNWRSHGVSWRSGHFYTFRYNAFRQDPEPTIILMYKIEGINKDTGHQWRLIQGININYIPRAQRKAFVTLWQNEMEKNKGNVEFTWNLVQMRFPYLELAVRRYVTKPVYRIQKARYIPVDQLEDAVISTWGKDFNKKVEMDINAKRQRIMGRGTTLKDKYKKKWGMFSGLKSFFGVAKGLFNRGR